MKRQVSPMAGLPDKIGDTVLAWAKGLKGCCACGRTVFPSEVLLCGRCCVLLADGAGPQRIQITPEERARIVRRQRRKQNA